MLSFLKFRRRSDDADSTMVSFILIFPLFFGILMTIIDTSVYFANRSIVANIARDSAREAAIFGGPGTGQVESKLEQEYGSTCTPTAAGGNTWGPDGQMSGVECQLANKLYYGSGLTNVKVTDVSCTTGQADQLASKVGDVITCAVKWNYGGIPGSVLGFVRGNGSGGTNKASDGTTTILEVNNTTVTSQSEVGLAATDHVARS